MGKTLYIHVGTGKTGTTSLQHFLWENREQLAADGVLYPEVGFDHSAKAHHVFGHLWGDTGWKAGMESSEGDKERVLGEIRDVFESSDKSVLLSTEALTRILINEKREPFFRDIADSFDLSQVKIIVYLRRQDKHIQSAFKEAVKNAWDNTNLNFKPVNAYYPWVSRLVEVFGRENVIIQPFETGQFINGSLFETFLDHLGIRLSPAYRLPEAEHNISMSARSLALCRLANKVGGPEDVPLKRQFNAQVRAVLDNGARYSLFSAEEIREIMAGAAEDNERIAREFMGRADGVLFREPLPEPGTLKKQDLTIGSEMVAKIFVKVWRAQQQRIQELERENRAPRKRPWFLRLFGADSKDA